MIPKRGPILLIADNTDNIELIRAAFQTVARNHELVVARDGLAALDYLFCRGRWAERDPRIEPRLILLDCDLPDRDGLEALQAIRADAHTVTIPVVALTAAERETEIAMAYKLGANSCVRKPADAAESLAIAQQIGLYWLTLNRPVPGH